LKPEEDEALSLSLFQIYHELTDDPLW